jgi:malate dehydrogenase (oxaloacetate-decarboxylating)(NADP+)
VLLGPKSVIEKKIRSLGLELKGAEFVDPDDYPQRQAYLDEFIRLRQRHGVTQSNAGKYLADRNYFGVMMVHLGDVDCLVAGLTQHYPDTIRPALQIVKTRKDTRLCSGLYMMVFPKEVIFFADTTVNVDNNAPEDLAEIAISAAELAKSLDIEPRIAMLSFSNFGSVKHPDAERVRQAVEIVKQRRPDLVVDGEMQADTAVDKTIQDETYPFCDLKGTANILIFPDMQSGNIAYKLVGRLGGAAAIGPILMGVGKAVHVLQRGCSVDDIVNIAAIAVVDAQGNKKA